jgi:hypothetical protein
VTDNNYVIALIGSVLILAAIVELLRRRQLKEKYAALWLIVGLVLVVFTAFPALLTRISSALGVAVPTNLLFFVAILFLVGVVLHLSWEASRLENETRKLAEDVAILRLDLAELKREREPENEQAD